MIGKVKNISVFVSGYEANITIDFIDLGEVCCCALLDYEHNSLLQNDIIEIYLEDRPPIKIEKNSILDIDLKIDYGNELKKINKIINGYFQNIINSPHAIFEA